MNCIYAERFNSQMAGNSVGGLREPLMLSYGITRRQVTSLAFHYYFGIYYGMNGMYHSSSLAPETVFPVRKFGRHVSHQPIVQCARIASSVTSGYAIRQIKEEDVESVATMCHDAFKCSDRGFLSPAAQSERQWASQFSRAIRAKRRAREEFWHIKDLQERAMVKEMVYSGTSRAKHQYVDSLGQTRKPLPSILRKLFIFVVEEKDSGIIVGCASISMARCESALPPPFPTSKPFRCYASNIVVVDGHRRNGVGERLVTQCERIARLWGEKSLWLHVEEDNIPALALYDKRKYNKVPYFALYGNGKTQLRAKSLPRLPPRKNQNDAPKIGKMNDQNVFIWG